ncbi:C1 family peptidase [Vagococcus carniphilus]|nr:C1 family peptidase [Vagococcus carniphilus]MDT2815361.1 C1 family peptidase [Vagococcus carniphilus]MDT2830668.1 C1 family peptidase [Vagococcus carniphilus]MDT2839560.1 C1 family peptidase [Vagococcus carniphilus]MDT2853831.1 C1 family peptidase [Vagococcus carniphilus]MDT2866405.1 C1 family peptidase [Vagococcus carniphilus]
MIKFMSKEISIEQIKQFNNKYHSVPSHLISQRAVMKNGILASSENQASIVKNNPVFSIDLDTGDVSNQKQSGRCWMFAALNTFRHQISQTFHIKDFELSQNYTFFWDKFEKANYFYENILATSNESLTSRKVAFLLQTPQQDGGQWDMLVAIIQKYGIVPKQIMPETFSSSQSREINDFLNKKLRKDAVTLRKMVADNKTSEEIAQVKENMLQEIYNLLATSLGTPPDSFDFSYVDTDGNYQLKQNLTPQSFYDEFIGRDLTDYVSVINAPTADKPYNHMYSVELLGNVVGGKEVRHLNVDIETFKKLAIDQLKAGEAVWYGCDVGQSSTKDSGVMATDVYSVSETLDIDYQMTKAERLDYGESLMTHAMVITGVDLVDDKPTKWKIENSWGDKVGTKGYFVMSDDWLNEYTYQIVINKKFLPTELQDIVKKDDVTVLAPWDPMGALA